MDDQATIPPQPPLSSSERSTLRARAHRLDPVVMISANGTSPAVLAEIDRSLAHHELIKIRVMDAERDERDALMATICERTGAQPVQHIGKILVVYRHNPNPPAAPKREEQPPPRKSIKPRRPLAARRGTSHSPGAGAAAPRRFVSEARRAMQRRGRSR
jgi:putative YhbY family RNA-binding protein